MLDTVVGLERTEMDLMLLTSTVIFASLGVVFTLLFRELVGRESASPLTENWDNLFCPQRYRPLQRLLDNSDYRYLASQPKCGRALARRYHVERTEIFRGYMRCLRKDFVRVLGAIKVVMLQSRVDRPDLARILFRQRLQFSLGMMSVECRLVLFRYGLSSMDLQALVGALDTVRGELRVLAMSAQPVAVGAAA